jgi:hypothetical protein
VTELIVKLHYTMLGAVLSTRPPVRDPPRSPPFSLLEELLGLGGTPGTERFMLMLGYLPRLYAGLLGGTPGATMTNKAMGLMGLHVFLGALMYAQCGE